MADGGDAARVPDFPSSSAPRPGALSLLTPAQRGLCLAMIQADRCGRGGDDLAVLSGKYNTESDAAKQYALHNDLLSGWTQKTQKTPR